MKAVINLTESNEIKLNRIKAVFAINNISLKNKEEIVNKSIDLLDNLITSMNEEDLVKIAKLKKTF